MEQYLDTEKYLAKYQNDTKLRAFIPSKKVLLGIDMDGVVVDFDSSFLEMKRKGHKEHEIFRMKGFYESLNPISEEAVYVVSELLASDFYDVYFVSTPSWSNSDSWKEKKDWIQKFFGKAARKKLILTHNKGFFGYGQNSLLIDDRIANGVSNYVQNGGVHCHFGTEPEFMNWDTTAVYLKQLQLVYDLEEIQDLDPNFRSLAVSLMLTK